MAKKNLSSPQSAQDLSSIARDAIAKHAQVTAQVFQALDIALEIGDLLLAAKKKVKHGDWQNWIKENMSWSVRMAQSYMELARNRRVLNKVRKTQCISFMTISDALKLVRKKSSEQQGKASRRSDAGSAQAYQQHDSSDEQADDTDNETSDSENVESEAESGFETDGSETVDTQQIRPSDVTLFIEALYDRLPTEAELKLEDIINSHDVTDEVVVAIQNWVLHATDKIAEDAADRAGNFHWNDVLRMNTISLCHKVLVQLGVPTAMPHDEDSYIDAEFSHGGAENE